jgi:hypothetical protein
VIEVSSEEEGKGKRTLTVHLVDHRTAVEEFAAAERQFIATLNPEIINVGGPRIILHYETPGGEPRTSIGVGTRGASGIVWRTAQIDDPVASVYLTSGRIPSGQDVDDFSKLEEVNRQGEILPALQVLEPRLRRLSLLRFAGETAIHGDVGLNRLVPLAFMGEGVRRFLSIVLAIATAPGGVVLIDEVENGLHHSVLRKVWQAIGMAARQAGAQVYATTHSYECINAAHEAFSAREQFDLALYRLDRIDDRIEAVRYDQEMMAYALEMFHEVR